MREINKNQVSLRYCGHVYIVPKGMKADIDKMLKPWAMTPDEEKQFTAPETALPAKNKPTTDGVTFDTPYPTQPPLKVIEKKK